MTCPACHYSNTHSASCPTQLDTVEKRIERAAHLHTCFYSWGARPKCTAEGLTDLEIRAGAALAELRLRERTLVNEAYGDPAYGSRTIPAERLERTRAAERKLVDAFLLENLSLEERMVASTAVLNYRRQQAQTPRVA